MTGSNKQGNMNAFIYGKSKKKRKVKGMKK